MLAPRHVFGGSCDRHCNIFMAQTGRSVAEEVRALEHVYHIAKFLLSVLRTQHEWAILHLTL